MAGFALASCIDQLLDPDDLANDQPIITAAPVSIDQLDSDLVNDQAIAAAAASATIDDDRIRARTVSRQYGSPSSITFSTVPPPVKR
jgi:hypothetical protein